MWENELSFWYFKLNGLSRKLPEASDGEIVSIAWWDEVNEGLCGVIYPISLIQSPGK